MHIYICLFLFTKLLFTAQFTIKLLSNTLVCLKATQIANIVEYYEKTQQSPVVFAV